MSNFASYASYYDLLYRDKDYVGEAAYVERLIEREAPHAKRLLELGCGTGKHAEHFAKAGYSVLGVDRSAAMVAQAKARGIHGAEFRVGDACEVQGTAEFDVVLALFHVLSYQTSDADVARMMQAAAAALKHGGVFIFDYWYGPAVLHERPEKRTKTMENETTKVVRYCTPTLHETRHVVDVAYEIHVQEKANGKEEVLHELHPMRYFFAEELAQFTASAGFELLGSEVWMKGGAPTNADFGVVSMARKL